MTNASVANTRLKYGNIRIAFIPNAFDNCELSEAVAVLGDARHAELKAKAKARGWSEKRFEAEIRCEADEAAANAEL